MPVLCLALIITILACGPVPADWNVTEFGAVGDGMTDCTAAFQKALDEAGKAGGGVVNVPAGRYAIKGNLSIPAGVTLQGTYRATPLAFTPDYEKMPGTILLAYAGRGSNEGKPFINLRSSAAVMGVIIVYPEWNKTDVPPVPYPPCIAADDTNNVAVIDVAIMNAYEAIKFVRAHRHLIRNFQGYPSWRGIYVDQCYDIGRIENVHIWPFGVVYDAKDPYCEWINLNGTAFEFARTDWEYVTNTFCFGYGVGYKFSQTEHGSANGNFLGIGADCCERAVLVEQCQGPGLLITNGEFVGRWGSKDAVCIEIGEKTRGKVSLVNCSFWGPIDRCVWMRSPHGWFTASATHFLSWDVKRTGVPALQIDAGHAIIQGNTFGNGELHVLVGDKVASAIISGNQAIGGMVIENKAGGKTKMFGNQEQIGLTDKQKASYTIQIGSESDLRRIRHWHGSERAGTWANKGTMRWSAPGAQLILPVLAGKPYEIALDIYIPEYALQPDAGLYLGNKRIISFLKPGKMVLKGSLPASKSDKVILDIRCKGWIPRLIIPGSKDNRTLGVALRAVTMKAK